MALSPYDERNIIEATVVTEEQPVPSSELKAYYIKQRETYLSVLFHVLFTILCVGVSMALFALPALAPVAIPLFFAWLVLCVLLYLAARIWIYTTVIRAL